MILRRNDLQADVCPQAFSPKESAEKEPRAHKYMALYPHSLHPATAQKRYHTNMLMYPDVQLIWRDLHQELRRFILLKVKDETLTDDLLQDTFLKVHLGLSELKDCDKLTSWVYQITRNVITDHFRKAKPEPWPAAISAVAEEEATYDNLSRCINTKIKALPAKYREALLLTTFKNLAQTELANYLGISYSGAKSRVQRGRETLTQLVADCDLVETDLAGKITGHELDE